MTRFWRDILFLSAGLIAGMYFALRADSGLLEEAFRQRLEALNENAVLHENCYWDKRTMGTALDSAHDYPKDFNGGTAVLSHFTSDRGWAGIRSGWSKSCANAKPNEICGEESGPDPYGHIRGRN